VNIQDFMEEKQRLVNEMEALLEKVIMEEKQKLE
jgi:hypothetical protein